MRAITSRIALPGALAALALACPGTAAAALQQPPMILPGEVRLSSKAADPGTWIVGGQPGRRTAAIARSAGAEPLIAEAGVYSVSPDRARALADRLDSRGLLVYAEPDSIGTRAAFPSDPMTPGAAGQTWLPLIINTSVLTPPTVTGASPLLGVIEESVNAGHSDLAAGGNISGPSRGAALDVHGTEVAGVAAAPANGIGVVGVWPGARATVFASDPSCESTSRAVIDAVNSGARVLNMSYEFAATACFTHLVATQMAFGAGVVLVSAAGNERDAATGTSIQTRPAIDPHVLTVGATDGATQPASFSTEGAAVDIAAPGVAVLTTTTDPANGFAYPSGTSFSTPMVATAALWLRAVRPGLAPDQVSDVLRDSAVDIAGAGWDPRTGFGLLDVQQALLQPERPADPLEPNDDIQWVNGSALGAVAPPVLGKKGRKLTPINARLDKQKDQVDVYRAQVAPKSRVLAGIKPLSGDPDLEVWSSKTKTVLLGNQGLIDFSRKKGLRRERVTVRNRTKKKRIVFIAVYVDAAKKARSSSYVLNLR